MRMAASVASAPVDNKKTLSRFEGKVLTSLDDAAMAELGWPGNVPETVLRLSEVALEAGLDGVVASAHEAPALRKKLGPEAILVTPGIRASGADMQDQARVATPLQALQGGADYLVVGRPVIAQPDPVAALRGLRRQTGS